MPITWKNINVPSLNTTGINQGANLLSKGVDQLAQVAKDYNTGLTDSATDDLLGRIAATGDMNAYNTLRQEIAANGVGNADSSKVWQALNSRDNDIRADLTGGLNLGKLQRTEAMTVATQPLLDQVAGLSSVTDIDNFVKGLNGIDGTNVDLTAVVNAADARRGQITGNTLTDSSLIRDGINTSNVVREDQNNTAVLELNPVIQGLVNNASSLSEAKTALNKELKGLDPSVQASATANFEALWQQSTGLTANEQLDFERQLEDVGSQVYQGDMTFNQAKTQLDTEEVRLQNQLNKIPESMRPGVEALTPGELSQLVVKDFGLDDDRWFTFFEATKEDVPRLLSNLEEYARENIPTFAPDENGNLPEIPTAVLLETLRQAGLNDYDDGSGEIDEASAKKAFTAALDVWNTNQASYNDYLGKSNALKNKRAALASGLKQATRGIEDEINTAADAKRILR